MREPLLTPAAGAGDHPPGIRVDVLIDQLRAIDNRQLVRGPLTRVGRQLMTRVGEALLEVLDLAEDGMA